VEKVRECFYHGNPIYSTPLYQSNLTKLTKPLPTLKKISITQASRNKEQQNVLPTSTHKNTITHRIPLMRGMKLNLPFSLSGQRAKMLLWNLS